jgi:cobalt/nickel transport system ATP-binding protein
MGKIFEACGLCHTYPDGNKALNEMNFCLEEGEKLFVVGANGSGKSTLLFHFVGTLLPTEGELLFHGKNMTTGDKAFITNIRSRVGLVFQNPDNQLFMESVYDDVAFAPRNAGKDINEIEICVNKALEKVKIEHLINRSPWRLSVGEKRLAALASVLSMEPEVLVLDEPSAFLDPCARRELMELLYTLDCAQVIATHDLDMALDIGSRVIVLDKGNIAADSKIPGILADEVFLKNHRLELPLSLKYSLDAKRISR